MEDPKYPGIDLAPRFEDQEVTVTQPVHVGYYSRVTGKQYELDGSEVVEAPAKKTKPAKAKAGEGEQA